MMNEAMKKAGFGQPAGSTRPVITQETKEVMTAAEVAMLEARAEEARRVIMHNEEITKSKEAKDKPLEAGIKVVQGQITAIDHGTHKVTVKDIKGVHHEMMWKGNLADKMAKLKQWWFCSISAEKSGEYWVVIDQSFYKRPEEWPVSAKTGYGGKAFTPKNEAAIIMQSSLKVCAEVAIFCSAPGGDNYEAMIEMIYASAKEMTESIRRDFP